ncbi:CPBP family intramembrane metalloprotease, partial [Streptomyces sp. SID8455]|nr:CPBP family intramembrane metalloprotease [Streptomyces sp. SID8455]
MPDRTDSIQADRPGRSLAWPWFLVVVIVYAGIIQGLGLLIGVD